MRLLRPPLNIDIASRIMPLLLTAIVLTAVKFLLLQSILLPNGTKDKSPLDVVILLAVRVVNIPVLPEQFPMN